VAAPTFVSATNPTLGTTTTAATINVPTTAADDILILVWVNGGATAAPTLTTGTFTLDTNWASIDSGTWTTGAGGCYWVRCTGDHSGTTQILTGLTNSCTAMLIRVSGCITTGSPIDNSTGASVAAADGSLTGFNTNVAETLVCLTAATDDNQTKSGFTKNAVAMSHLSLSTSSGGTDTGVGYADAEQAAAGATGNFAITEAAVTAEGKRLSAFSLLPIPPVPVIPDVVMAPVRL
jgi:hypothetical protein